MTAPHTLSDVEGCILNIVRRVGNISSTELVMQVGRELQESPEVISSALWAIERRYLDLTPDLKWQIKATMANEVELPPDNVPKRSVIFRLIIKMNRDLQLAGVSAEVRQHILQPLRDYYTQVVVFLD